MMSSPAHTAPPNSAVPLLDIPDGVSIWDADALEAERRRNSGDDRAGRLMQTINSLGLRSQMAQGINAVLTSVARLRENRQARLYLLCKDGHGLGILKVGVKKLFVTHPVQHCLVEIDPLCVLDFFVDEKCQRCGYGRQLFEHMLAHERLRPEQVAIDRPSTQFLAFLHRHYGLVEYTPQSNKFVVFHRYFSRWQPPRGRGRDPNSHGPNSHGPNSHGPNSHGPNSHGPNSHGPNSHGPNSHGPNSHGPNSHGPNIHGPNIHGPNIHGPNSHGPNIHGPNSHGPNIHGPSGGPPLPAVRALGRGPPRDQTAEQRPPGPARQNTPPPMEGADSPGPSVQQAPAPSPERPKSPYELQYEAYMRKEAEREQRHKEWQLHMQQHQQRCRRDPPQKPLAQADFCAANRGTEPCGMNSGARGR